MVLATVGHMLQPSVKVQGLNSRYRDSIQGTITQILKQTIFFPSVKAFYVSCVLKKTFLFQQKESPDLQS